MAFFLGAGASFFMDVPTTKELVEKLLNYHRSCKLSALLINYKNKTIEDLYEDINGVQKLDNNMVLQNIPSICSGIDDDNIDDSMEEEQHICEHPYLKNISHQSECPKDALVDVKNSLNEFVFESLQYDKLRLHDYVNILREMHKISGSKITNIITTNYDMLIEDSCNELNLNIINGFEKRSNGQGILKRRGNFKGDAGIKLLKPHGSLNWHKDDNEYIYSESITLRYAGDKSVWLEPVPLKKETNLLKQIRNEVYRVLDDCELLIVIGVSFADTFWKKEIEKRLKKGMRMLYISPSCDNDFTNQYGVELKLGKDGVEYEGDYEFVNKRQEKYIVDYYKYKFGIDQFENLAKVIQFTKAKIK